MYKLAILLALIPAAAQAQQAGMQPSAPDKIVAAAMDCWAAVGATKVDRALLQSRGWTAGQMKSAKGETVKSELAFYGKPGASVMIMLADSPKAKTSCTVVSRVSTPSDIAATAAQLSKAIKAAVPSARAARSDLSIAYIGGPRVAMLEPTGTKDKPATRIVIAYSPPETKK